MASRTFPPIGALVLNLKVRTLHIRFFPDTANPPTTTAQDVKGVASIVRSAQGVFLITLQDTYKRLLSAHCSVQHTTAVDLVAQFGDISNVGTANPVTVVVRLNAVATPTDMAAGANNSVLVTLTFDDSDV